MLLDQRSEDSDNLVAAGSHVCEDFLQVSSDQHSFFTFCQHPHHYLESE